MRPGDDHQHYLKRAPKLLKPRKHGGPVPFLSYSTEIHPARGLVGIIAPWNFPFATGLSDAIPALMAGNAILLKPDNKTALSPLYGISLLEQAGLPKVSSRSSAARVRTSARR